MPVFDSLPEVTAELVNGKPHVVTRHPGKPPVARRALSMRKAEREAEKRSQFIADFVMARAYGS